MNKVILMGRLTHQPELKTTETGINVCKYRIAVQKLFKKDEADFFNIVAFEKRGEFVSRYFGKGDMIAIVGRLAVSSYKTKNGETRYSTEVIADEQYFCGGRTKRGSEEASEDDFYEVTDAEDGDLPF